MRNNTIFSYAGNDSLAVTEEHEMNLGDILKLTFQVLLALFGASGNTLVIAVLARMGNKKQKGDFYLQNLAIADLGTLLLTFPIAAIKGHAPYNWPFGQFGCQFLFPISEIFYGASVWFITVIAVERYSKVVTVKPFARNKHKTLLRRAMAVGVCVWMVSFIIFSLPLFLVVEYYEFQHEATWCGPEWPSWDHQRIISGGYYVILTLFSYIVPLVIISFTYLMISRTVERSNVFIKAIHQDQNVQTRDKQIWRTSVRLSHNKRVKKILTPLVLVFAVTMLPLSTLRIIVAAWPAIAEQQYKTYENLLFVVTVFSLINSSVNPVIYCMVSRNFRKQIKGLCSRRR